VIPSRSRKSTLTLASRLHLPMARSRMTWPFYPGARMSVGFVYHRARATNSSFNATTASVRSLSGLPLQ
jgi:hypothetical protein